MGGMGGMGGSGGSGGYAGGAGGLGGAAPALLRSANPLYGRRFRTRKARRMNRLFIADPSLKDIRGHHYMMTREATRRRDT